MLQMSLNILETIPVTSYTSIDLMEYARDLPV